MNTITKTTIVVLIALLVGAGMAAMLIANPGTTQDPPLAGISGPDVQSYLNVHGTFQQGGCVTSIATTSATRTLTGAELAACNIIEVSANGAALTLTLPATTTLSTAIQNPGDYREWVIVNKTATSTTIAAGSGIDLQEPDGQNVVITSTDFAWLTCFRTATAGGVVCRVDETIPAD